MIEEFIETVSIIDNTASEVEGLVNKLGSKKILYDCFDPKEFKKKRFKLKNRKLIFLDLFIDNSLTTATEQIALIRRYFKQIIGLDFGTYGIILWTKHLEEIELFKEKIAQDKDLYTLPLFVVGLNKMKYLTEGFNDIFSDIDLCVSDNTAASFFIRWSIAIERGKSKTISDIFSLVNKYQFQDENLNFLLYHLAKNKTGIHHQNLIGYPLHNDAYKAFSELLMYDISSEAITTNCQLFNPLTSLRYSMRDGENTISKDFSDNYTKNGNPDASKREKKIIDEDIKLNFTKINSKMLFDEDILDKSILPGNIYRIKDTKSIFISEKIEDGDIPVIIEMTPPCDFANRKESHPKVLGGFIAKYDSERIKSKLKGEAFYTESHPLKLKMFEEDKMIVFDFRYIGVLKKTDLIKTAKYKLMYRAKDKLFADILQKLSSHIARLGLSVLH